MDNIVKRYNSFIEFLQANIPTEKKQLPALLKATPFPLFLASAAEYRKSGVPARDILTKLLDKYQIDKKELKPDAIEKCERYFEYFGKVADVIYAQV
jgi:hypothetical protein